MTELLRRDIENVVRIGPAATRHRELATPLWPGLARRVSCEPTTIAGVSGLWVTPVDWGGGTTILYLHGGGYCFCSSATHRDLAARIAFASGARCLALDYRLAPEYPHPAALDDSTAVYLALIASGACPDRLILAGDSAGGGLALATMVALRDAADLLPRAAVLISPWVDLTCSGESIERNTPHDYLSCDVLRYFAASYLGDLDPRTPSASPLYADLAGLPPMLIQVGEIETLRSEGDDLAALARAAGVEVELQVLAGAVHVSQAFAPVAPEARPAIDAIGTFIRRSEVSDRG